VIALDSNVVVRLFVDDDPEQNRLARDFFARRLTAATPGFVSLVVVVEVFWVLRRVYGIAEPDIRRALLGLLESEQIVVERPLIARGALADDGADLADALIHAIGRGAGCDRTVTFDRRFARHDAVELIA